MGFTANPQAQNQQASGGGFLPGLKKFMKNIEAYEEAMSELNAARKELKKMAAGLSHMKNVMYGVMEFMNMFQNVEGAKVKALSDVQNIDSDLRSQISEAQGDVNQFESGVGHSTFMNLNTQITPKEKAQMQSLMNLVDMLNFEVKILQGVKGLSSSSVVKNIEDGIGSIKGAFQWPGSKGSDQNAWGSPTRMAHYLHFFVQQAGKEGKYSSNLKNLQFGFQTLNQTTSALSTSTNTNLQFVTAMFKQFLGVDESSMKAYQEMNSKIINNINK